MTRVSITRKINVRDPNVLPAWVPEPGTFANISTNTLFQVRPTGWPTGESAGPFANWAGGVYCADFGSDGGYAVFGSGHLSQGAALWAGVWVFDLSTLAWVGRNVPSEPLLEPTVFLDDYDNYGASTDVATLGHPYPPHTYDGLIYQPTANGGGTDGNLIQIASAGTSGITGAKRVFSFDLSSASDAPTRVIDNITSMVGSYPASCLDTVRNGFWVVSADMQSPLTFVSFADWSRTTYSSVVSNAYGTDASLTYIPDKDCIVAMHPGSGGAGIVMKVCRIVNNVPQPWVTVNQSGVLPTRANAGAVWSTLLGCLVSYQGVPSYTTDLTPGRDIYKTIPPDNVVADTWFWSKETLTPVGAAEPVVTRDGNNNILNNGAWSRFVEVPWARCFLYAGSINGPVQAWRPLGT